MQRPVREHGAGERLRALRTENTDPANRPERCSDGYSPPTAALVAGGAGPLTCSTSMGIPLVRRASQSQSVLPGANFPQLRRRSDDGQTIMRAARTDSDMYPDLVFWVGATGFEPVTPRL